MTNNETNLIYFFWYFLTFEKKNISGKMFIRLSNYLFLGFMFLFFVLSRRLSNFVAKNPTFIKLWRKTQNFSWWEMSRFFLGVFPSDGS